MICLVGERVRRRGFGRMGGWEKGGEIFLVGFVFSLTFFLLVLVRQSYPP